MAPTRAFETRVSGRKFPIKGVRGFPENGAKHAIVYELWRCATRETHLVKRIQGKYACMLWNCFATVFGRVGNVPNSTGRTTAVEITENPSIRTNME